jgi:serine/threonine protein kinase
MSNPTAMFPISINQSFESVSTTVLKDLNRYEIIGRLGTGTFGKVKLARYNNEELVIRILNELRIK